MSRDSDDVPTPMCRILGEGEVRMHDGMQESREEEDESHSNPDASRGSVAKREFQYDDVWYDNAPPAPFADRCEELPAAIVPGRVLQMRRKK